jgi:hypothetical protein
MDDWDSFVGSLAEDTAPIALKKSVEKVYPCGQCAGTGLYAGVRVHQEKSNCFACKGKGYFKTDPRKLEKARLQRAKKKRDAIESAQALNITTHIYTFVVAMASWNELSASLLEQHNQGKAWSEKQVLAIQGMVDRMEERRIQKAAEAQSVDLTSIIDMFTYAKTSGYKRPVYRAEGLKISLAPESSANVGALYVKTNGGDYIGKVSEGKFFATNAATDEHKRAIALIAINPRDAAIRYGRQTGSCACCGRALSNKESVDRGVGPICFERWGFM